MLRRRDMPGRIRTVALAATLVLAACGDDDEVPPEQEAAAAPAEAAVEDTAFGEPELEDPFDEDPFAEDDPFVGDERGEEDWGDGYREGPDALPSELRFLLDVPAGARLDHVEAFEGSQGWEYSVDASYHDAGEEQLEAAFHHYRSLLPAGGFEIVEEYRDDGLAELYATGHGLEASLVIDMEMGSVWINLVLFPEW